MRYIADSNGYLQEVSFGAEITCGDASCVEYTGSVPEDYASLEAWYIAECERLYRWKIVSGELTLDAAATVPTPDGRYPVGAIYISTVETSPASLFGGTWERIKDKFLLAAGDSYAAGASGGEATTTLTVDQIPSHRHNFYRNRGSLEWTHTDGSCVYSSYTVVGTWTERTDPTGGGAAHNNMPPYLAAYVWRRIA